MKHKVVFFLCGLLCLSLLCGCGVIAQSVTGNLPQASGDSTETSGDASGDIDVSVVEEKLSHVDASSGTVKAYETKAWSLLDWSDAAEYDAVMTAKKLVASMSEEPRIVATSPATVSICDALDLELVGVSESALTEIPERYVGVTTVGSAMSPDMEQIGALDPDWILSPVSLAEDLQPKYAQLDSEYAFLNLSDLVGMFQSIDELGTIFQREEQAKKLETEFVSFYSAYQSLYGAEEKPKVLILMGLPGSYVIATDQSYIGSLVELAGGENVYSGESEAFISVNTEDLETMNPDIILRAAHALPDSVTEMFQEEFATNDIWKHFTAVQEGRVYDLPYDVFGMSANFQYQEALEELAVLFYEEGE